MSSRIVITQNRLALAIVGYLLYTEPRRTWAVAREVASGLWKVAQALLQLLAPVSTALAPSAAAASASPPPPPPAAPRDVALGSAEKSAAAKAELGEGTMTIPAAPCACEPGSERANATLGNQCRVKDLELGPCALPDGARVSLADTQAGYLPIWKVQGLPESDRMGATLAGGAACAPCGWK